MVQEGNLKPKISINIIKMQSSPHILTVLRYGQEICIMREYKHQTWICSCSEYVNNPWILSNKKKQKTQITGSKFK